MNSSLNNNGDPVAAKAKDEAASWLTRLNSRVVDTAELEDFFAWRRVPHNAEAYDELEAHWRMSLGLAGDRDIALALGEALNVDHGPLRWAGLRIAMVAGVVVLLACAAYFLLARDTVFQTVVGEQRLVQLEDGSRIHLDTNTRVSVDMGSQRLIHLQRGRVLFDVAHEPSRPFVVSAGVAQIRALGTKFEIDGTADRVQVALVEGQVEVSAQAASPGVAPLKLAPGQAVQVSPAGPGKIVQADTAAITAWTQGRLDFSGTPLATAIDEVNRYTRSPVRLKTTRWAGQRVNGGFAVGDVQAFVEAVTTLYPLRAQTMADGTIELHDR